MGLVYADITLINSEDLTLAKRHIIGKEKVKQMKVSMLADLGAYMMAINESIQEELQLQVRKKRKIQMANGSIEEYDVVEK